MTTSQVVAFDLEGTLTSGRISNGMANYLAKYKNVNLTKNLSLLELLALFKGFTIEEFERMSEWTVQNELIPNIRKIVINELYQHKALGKQVVIVSAMFEPILRNFSKQLDNIPFWGTQVVFKGDIFTGQITSSLNTDLQKVNCLLPLATNGKIYAAYGDTKSDIPMLKMSHHPTAVNPDKELLFLARQHNWRILMDKPSSS